MANRPPFEFGEWYHCFNRAVEKRRVFENEVDADRFLMVLYLANGTRPIKLFDVTKPRIDNVLCEDRGSPIVSVGAYCLMPNHFHLLLKETSDGGISEFMRRLGVAYAMYFNAKYERVGNLFIRPFRSRHVYNDRYLQRVIEYIHLNPAELFEPEWKQGRVSDMRELGKRLGEYAYSSFRAYSRAGPRDRLLGDDVFEVAGMRPISRMLTDARDYYWEVVRDGLER